MHAGIGYASGDDDPADNTVRTFNQLFPLGHKYLGFMDFVGRQNLIDVHAGVKFNKVFDKFWFIALGHLFWRAEDQDALFNAGAGVVRAGVPGTSLFVGSELDFIVKYKFDQHLDIILGYSHFFTGSFLNQTGSDNDMDFGYITIQYTF